MGHSIFFMLYKINNTSNHIIAGYMHENNIYIATLEITLPGDNSMATLNLHN
jgi:hypothetical protein